MAGADVQITGMAAVLAAKLTDAALLAVDDADSVTKKATVAQLRTQILAGLAGAVTSKAELTKAVTAIADATATDVLTITVPNAAHSALVRVMLAGSLGAGGAIGANEATGVVAYDIAIARTAGVAAVAGISAAYGAASAVVAGAATVTVTAAMSAVVGAVGASNSFTVKVTITKGSGASANHTCRIQATVLNANATGVSVS